MTAKHLRQAVVASGLIAVFAATAFPAAGRAPDSRSASLASCLSNRGKALQGAPSNALLSILGVLRRPATPADALPSGVHPGVGEIYVHYVRRARVIDGTSYYIFPVLVPACGPLKAHQGIWEFASHVELAPGIYGGAGGGAATAAQIEQGGDAGTGPPGSKSTATITMVVPDSVAKVTLHYPAGIIGGFDRRHAPAVTYATSPVGNLVVVTVMRRGNRLDSPTPMTWYDASGHVIKTLDGL